jgi:hypothetical protein
MGYSTRDVTKAIFDRIRVRNLSVVQDGKNIRVRVLVGTPDEAIAKKRYPSINISPGFYNHSRKDWQSLNKVGEVDGNFIRT